MSSLLGASLTLHPFPIALLAGLTSNDHAQVSRPQRPSVVSPGPGARELDQTWQLRGLFVTSDGSLADADGIPESSSMTQLKRLEVAGPQDIPGGDEGTEQRGRVSGPESVPFGKQRVRERRRRPGPKLELETRD
ncbi:hypothetical protein E5288_WYG008563 [Bos mutus]|uniref:Uncharacterized protein n=1 Tax=Bos mutus TaxID=72004 RepID=A0A6B0RZ55_9CETA|nr:hypothetical protein [Bos mutus]